VLPRSLTWESQYKVCVLSMVVRSGQAKAGRLVSILLYTKLKLVRVQDLALGGWFQVAFIIL